MKNPDCNNDISNEEEEINNKYLCPQCGKPAKGYKIGDCLRILCPSCGCDAVTTYFDELDLDEATYTLQITGNEANTENIKAMSNMFELHYLDARSYLLDNSYKVEGSARKIYDIKKQLDESEIKYSITPKFYY